MNIYFSILGYMKVIVCLPDELAEKAKRFSKTTERTFSGTIRLALNKLLGSVDDATD